MSNFCRNCGAELKPEAKFCTSCGQKVEQVSAVSVATSTNTNSGNNFNHSGITRRSIPLAIILSIVTCGLYGIYWQVKLNDESNELAGKTNATSGVMAAILSIVTCGIYYLYWMYKMGENVEKIKGKSGDTGILYLILGLLCLGLIPMALIQDTINDKVDGVI